MWPASSTFSSSFEWHMPWSYRPCCRDKVDQGLCHVKTGLAPCACFAPDLL